MTEELFREDAFARQCDASVVGLAEDGVRLDRTVFYCTGGGQPGDRGRLILDEGGALEVVDTVKAADGIVHRLAEGSALPQVGARLRAEIDWQRRHRLMRMHSALHLLCRAVDCPVTGGQVGEARSRLDFDAGDSRLDKDAIAARLAQWITDDLPIRHFWIDAAELRRARSWCARCRCGRRLAAAGSGWSKSKGSTCRPAAAPMSAAPAKSASSRSARSRTRAVRTAASTSFWLSSFSLCVAVPAGLPWRGGDAPGAAQQAT